jgi:type I restriction enzyme M protein
MSDEQSGGPVPRKYGWHSLAELDAAAMHTQYARILSALGKRSGMLGLIFKNAKNKIRDPAKLRLLVVDLIGQTEWTGLSPDIKGDAYEGLLEKNARDTKSGAGQYFTPRPLIEAIVECINPQPNEVVCDPACGTGGFLLTAHEHIRSHLPKMTSAQRKHLATRAIRGVELVEEVARLATMNLLLHGVSGHADDEMPITCADSLKNPPPERVDVVLTNPPFGVKGSVTYSGDNGRRVSGKSDELTVLRSDFWVQTANKQLNFLQHVVALLKPGGRAAVVIPDNVLFESGAAAAIRRRLLQTCNVHTLLRLPTGLFYAQGVNANVIFFDRLGGKRQRTINKLWVYDLRSENRFSLKTKPLRREDMQEFIELFRRRDRLVLTARNGTKALRRWRFFDTATILQSEDCRLDLAWGGAQKDRASTGLSRLDEISRLIADDLRRALSLMQPSTSRDK